MFGAVSGAYTGAVDKWGLVKKAEAGTLFIDELQSIDFDLQGKLITFIENKEYRRVGDAESHHADVRFIFASNLTLQTLVTEGRLRDDFAYRLERLQLNLPPLCERRLDIAAGICFALAKVLRERSTEASASSLGSSNLLEGISPSSYAALFAGTWPGNLRQLENTVATLVEQANIKGRSLIDAESTNEALQGLLGKTEVNTSAILSRAAVKTARYAETAGIENLALCRALLAENARLIALEETGGSIDKAAALLGDSARALELFTAVRSSEYE